MKGIIDRFEKNLAVILVEGQNKEYHIQKSDLPTNCSINSVVQIEERNGHIYITSDMPQEKQQQDKVTALRKALLNKENPSKLKRKK
ncbi:MULTISPECIES: DUF3006 domain-containing protein [Oceanobacillus]|uniref:DUF3006 domain-containing protein n=1 Tax=Oceanobacillus kimchii TaxID=746691 RepID=A0ABQ5TKG8_9BACI|nr:MULTISPECIES: DUF3006 domain-containing protein [Oceanobacillus]MBT2600289.1 DUF3006 domain-containing protein [Oceanobacillus sp. ISL-74]MBT2650447.1 DUF3006 domain-containing protein [Oceanobacillus sp. ISL-73]GLO67338.1 hypothetical protein MACH08_31220 [Oceanobacillus kimchii]